MTRAVGGVSALLAVTACGGLAILAPSAAAKEIAPFRAALVVAWGEGAGSDAFRDDLSRSLAATLATRCFAGVVIADRDPPPADIDLVLTIVLSGAVDETRFDDSIASAFNPAEPSKELRRVAQFEVAVDATLSARATGAIARQKRFVVNVSRRPLYSGEDAQATARVEAIEQIVVDLNRALGCGGAKLDKRIRESLGYAKPPAADSR